MLAVCNAVSLRDDVKQYLPELLPNFTKLFEEAERTGRCAVPSMYTMCRLSSLPAANACHQTIEVL